MENIMSITFINLYLLLIQNFDAVAVMDTKIKPTKEQMAINYLQKYGFIQEQYAEDYSRQKRAILSLQRFHGIKQSGILDDETYLLMEKDRCGEKDMTNKLLDLKKIKRFGDFKVYVGKWSSIIPKYRQKIVLLDIFSNWEVYLSRKFRWNDTDEGDINIIFDSGGYYEKGSRPHFENALTRVYDANGKYYIYANEKVVSSFLLFEYSMNHMLSHLFGMYHTRGRTIRNPIMETRQLNVKMKRNLFNAKCHTSIKSVFSYVHDGMTYFFKKNKFWRIRTEYKVDAGYPKLMSSKWSGVPDDFDEVFVWGGSWTTYFFKGKYYYRYNSTLGRVDDGYPKLISDGWRNVPDNIDAAFTAADFKTYFFKDDLVYKYDNSKREVAFGYPKKISKLYPNAPTHLDSVMRYYYDGFVYFFKDNNYWRWDQTSFMAEGPFLISQGWENLCWSK